MCSEDEDWPGYEIKVIHPGVWDPDDNLDVEIIFADGRRFSASFFARKNIDVLFAKNKQTGECSDGLYLWASDMILVEHVTLETIRETIAGLLRDGEFESACSLLEEPDD